MDYRNGPIRSHSVRHDQEEDEETVIVYKESTPLEQPWEFSQNSAPNLSDQPIPTVETTQLKKRKCEEEQHRRHVDQKEAASSLKSRRRQRRSLGVCGLDFRGRQNVPKDEPSGDEGIETGIGIDNNDVDDFAFLTLMVGKMSSEKKFDLQQQQQPDGESDGSMESQKEIDTRGEGRNEEHLSEPTIAENMPENELVDVGDSKTAPGEKPALTNNNKESIQSDARANENDSKGNDVSRKQRCRTLCSPPEFDLQASDDYEDENGTYGAQNNDKRFKTPKLSAIPSHVQFYSVKNNLQEHNDNNDDEKMNSRQSSSFSDRKLYREKQNHQSRKSSKWRSHDPRESTKRRSSTSPSSRAVSLASTRTRKRPNTISRRAFASSLTSAKSEEQHSSEIARAATDVENTKSIVGLRPTHWRRGVSSVQKKRSDTKGTKPSKELAKTTALAAATRFPFKMPRRTPKSAKSNSKSPVENVRRSTVVVNNNHKISNPIFMQKNIAANTPSDKRRTPNEAFNPSFSFAPSFVPTKSAALSDDAIGEDSGDECRVVTTPIDASSTSLSPFKRRRRSKAAAGEWVRRLVSLRNTHSSDSVRLQNKAFARQRMLLDVSDPRKRAKTYTDVTIWGQYLGPWINVPEDMKITVLGYAHRHIQRLQNSIDSDQHNVRQQQKRKKDNSKLVSEHFFAWFTFTLATARRVELQRGCKLRIYNAIILPCRLPVELNIAPGSISHVENNARTKYTSTCENTVICTHLCERIA